MFGSTTSNNSGDGQSSSSSSSAIQEPSTSTVGTPVAELRSPLQQQQRQYSSCSGNNGNDEMERYNSHMGGGTRGRGGSASIRRNTRQRDKETNESSLPTAFVLERSASGPMAYHRNTSSSVSAPHSLLFNSCSHSKTNRKYSTAEDSTPAPSLLLSRSLPAPNAPMLSYRINDGLLLTSIPPMQLPQSAVNTSTFAGDDAAGHEEDEDIINRTFADSAVSSLAELLQQQQQQKARINNECYNITGRHAAKVGSNSNDYINTRNCKDTVPTPPTREGTTTATSSGVVPYGSLRSSQLRIMNQQLQHLQQQRQQHEQQRRGEDSSNKNKDETAQQLHQRQQQGNSNVRKLTHTAKGAAAYSLPTYVDRDTVHRRWKNHSIQQQQQQQHRHRQKGNSNNDSSGNGSCSSCIMLQSNDNSYMQNYDSSPTSAEKSDFHNDECNSTDDHYERLGTSLTAMHILTQSRRLQYLHEQDNNDNITISHTTNNHPMSMSLDNINSNNNYCQLLRSGFNSRSSNSYQDLRQSRTEEEVEDEEEHDDGQEQFAANGESVGGGYDNSSSNNNSSKNDCSDQNGVVITRSSNEDDMAFDLDMDC